MKLLQKLDNDLVHILDTKDNIDTSFREKLLDITLLLYFIAFSISVAIGFVRVLETGWLNLYSFYMVLWAVFFVSNQVKHRIGYHVKVFLIIGVFYGLSLAGMLNFGTHYDYNIYFGLCILISAIFLSSATTVRVFCFILMTQLVFLFLVWNGTIPEQSELIVQMNSMSSWVSRITAFVTIFVTTMIGVGWLNRGLERVLVSNIKHRKELEEAKVKLLELTETDVLTGLPNRRALYQFSEKQFSKYKRYGESFCVMMIDLDRFKKINDTYGHLAGDRVLAEVGQSLKKQVREYELVARAGGEEFVVILTDTDIEAGIIIAERIRQSIEATAIPYESLTLNVTASVGITQATASDVSFENVLKRADIACYQAKDDGRNNVHQLLE